MASDKGRMHADDDFGPETDVIEGLVVDAEGLVRVLHQLVHRQRRVVRLHHRVGHLFKEKAGS